MDKNKENASWLVGLMTGWGIKESWAKIIVGALMGALAAAGLLTQSGCSVALSRLPDGTVSFNGSVIAPVTVEEGK